MSKPELDKYYTKDSIVELCLADFEKEVFVSEDDVFVEPSAGGGAFMKQLKIKYSGNRIRCFDIKPEHADIENADYLKIPDSCFERSTHVIGNPPFGRQSSLAIKFIKKSAVFAESISFILPRSFKKASMHRAFPLYFHLTREIDIPENAFEIGDASYDVPCVFQIWERKGYPRAEKIKETTTDFTFVRKTENPNIAFRRVGANAGAISENTSDKSEQSHYFIKLMGPPTIMDLMRQMMFKADNTVGPRSISKSELVGEYLRVKGVSILKWDLKLKTYSFSSNEGTFKYS